MKSNQFAKFKSDEQAMMFNMLLTAGITVISLFAVLNIGTFLNGTINSSLIGSYATNAASGSINTLYYHNATGNGTAVSRITALPTGCTAGEIQTNSYVNVYNNGTDPIWFNLSANTNVVYNTTINAGAWRNTTLAAMITAGNVTSSATSINYTWVTNSSTNRIIIGFVGSYFVSSDYRSSIENRTVNSLENITEDYDGILDVMTATATIMVIMLPLAAVIAAKKLL